MRSPPPDEIRAVPTSAMVTTDEAVMMGYIAGVFGTRGWLKVHSYTRPRSNLLAYSVWLVGQPGAWREFALLSGKSHGPTLLAELAGIGTREQASELLRGQVAVLRTALPALPEDEHYWSDLLGMTVVNLNGANLGVVIRLVETGDHDVLVIRAEREYLIPFVRGRYVVEVDVASRRIVVDWHIDD